MGENIVLDDRLRRVENVVLRIEFKRAARMAIVTYVEHDGVQHQVEVPNGDSVMQGAMRQNLQGIVAECGGGLACATCHCYVEDAWIERAGAASEMELQMLDFSPNATTPGSRLSCQIIVSDALDGLVVRLPESQF
jgi:2Fe-2S ferredoxin